MAPGPGFIDMFSGQSGIYNIAVSAGHGGVSSVTTWPICYNDLNVIAPEGYLNNQPISATIFHTQRHIYIGYKYLQPRLLYAQEQPLLLHWDIVTVITLSVPSFLDHEASNSVYPAFAHAHAYARHSQ